jgi:integrase
MKLKRFYKKHGAYYFVDKAHKWHHLGRDYRQALQRYAALIDGPAPFSTAPTLNDLFDRYERDVVPSKAPKTQKSNEYQLKNLRRAFGHMRPEDVKPHHIYAYMDARQAKTAANREKSLLSHVLKYAIRWGFIADNPCRHVESFDEQPRRRYISDDEFWAIYEHATPHLQRAMVVAAVTGLRPADILALTWRNVTEDGLVVKPSKTKRSTGITLVYPWTDQLAVALLGTTAIECRDSDLPLIPSPRWPDRKMNPKTLARNFREASLVAFPKEDAEQISAVFRDLRVKAGTDGGTNRLLGNTFGVFNKYYNVKPQVVQTLPLPPQKQ